MRDKSFKNKSKGVNFKDKKHQKFPKDDEPDMSYEEPKMVGRRWYEEIKLIDGSITASEVSNEELDKLRREAATAFESDIVTNQDKPPKTISNADYTWIKTVMSKGTVGDKIAAYVLLIQDSPVINLGLLKNMVGMVKVGKKNECHKAIDTLIELFLNDILPPDRKLKFFVQQPLSKLDEITSGNIVARKRHLILWHFEDKLKQTYRDFVAALNVAAQDTVEANKVKVISAMFKLLAGHPEQESALLSYIVNKLGDPNHKVGSKVIYTLTKLLEIHPNMREIVMEEVEKVIFRSNISKRAQYYSVCFLTQFCLGSGDSKIAMKLISIYLALFKACVRTGEVDSRLMSALLTGVNRAFPYTEENAEILGEHINTMYKVVHLSMATVAIQALSLLHLLSKRSNNFSDRFYMVLYKKLGDPALFQSSHQAMFLSLIFKAVKNDKDVNRVVVFVKRLLQMCHVLPVPVICGILFLISEVLKNKKTAKKLNLEADESVVFKKEFVDDDDDGEEHYEDVKFEEDEAVEPVEPVAEPAPEILSESQPVFNIEEDKKESPGVWVNKDRETDSMIKGDYDPYHRNPLHACGSKTAYTELLCLAKHFHPTVSLFASKILNEEEISYSGDPLQDFSLMRFLDKFCFKNPKVIKKEEKETPKTFSIFGRKKNYTTEGIRRLRVNTEEYIKLEEKSVPVEEAFLYKYMKEKSEKDEELKRIKKEKGEDEDDESDVESVTSVEFEDVVRKTLGVSMQDDIDFLKEAGKLPKKSKMDKEESESDIEDEDEDVEEDFGDDNDDGDLEDDDEISAEEFDGDEMDDFSDDEDYDEESDLDTTELSAKLDKMGFPKKGKNKGDPRKLALKQKAKKYGKDNWFASADEFSELLEQSDLAAGGSEAVSNKDNAAKKQLKWEADRDKWVKGKNYRNKSNKRKNFQSNNKGSKRRKVK